MFARSYIPYSKLAGLPMFQGRLPFAQKEIGIDTRILLPAYPKISAGIENTHVVTEFDNFAGHAVLRYGEYNGVGIYLIDAPHLYWREGNPYHDTDYNDYADNYKRFALLAGQAQSLRQAQIVGGELTWCMRTIGMRLSRRLSL